jgi:hypothetical protein
MGSTQLERRARQRFDLNLPVSLRLSNDRQGSGFTQNLSARGLFLCTDLFLAEGDCIEVTLSMPSEVTLAEAMRVRCQGRILRVVPVDAQAKYFAAIQLEKYEYLPETDLPTLARVPAMLERVVEDEPALPVR